MAGYLFFWHAPSLLYIAISTLSCLYLSEVGTFLVLILMRTVLLFVLEYTSIFSCCHLCEKL